ncbi:MAG: ATP phosphoribosyltransferase regulatory subunit [Clostridia bacterium]|nr:ATP phosphoribosyltransferase regulatory subunit [Clostridia bacterium]
MKIEDILSAEELVSLRLRALYAENGYSLYKMSKFEEYDLYASNKDFLESERIITFTDTTGKLMALKPDVTLSIIKNTDLSPGEVKKVYYNENVYRVPKNSPAFREITQTGLECIGRVTPELISEVVRLASQSLSEISGSGVLDVSHYGLIGETLDSVSLSADAKKRIFEALCAKNAHEIKSICEKEGLSASETEKTVALSAIYGPAGEAIPALIKVFGENKNVLELKDLVSYLKKEELTNGVNIDFSVPGNIKYYNGIVFKGYVKGLPNYVLSGGQYDRLLTRLKKNVKAIGFAVYLDALEQLETAGGEG